MKKVTIFAALIFSSFFAQAQTEVGFKFGPSLVNQKNTVSYHSWISNYSSERISVIAGVEAETMQKRMSINYGFFYEQKGYQGVILSKYNPDIINQSGTSSANAVINYVTAPVTAKLYFDKKNTVFIEGGFYLGYLMQEKYFNTGYVFSAPVYNSEKKLDFGNVLGVGVRLRTNNERLKIKANLRTSFSVNNNHQMSFSGSSDEMFAYHFFNFKRNLSISAIFGVSYNFGKKDEKGIK